MWYGIKAFRRVFCIFAILLFHVTFFVVYVPSAKAKWRARPENCDKYEWKLGAYRVEYCNKTTADMFLSVGNGVGQCF